MKNLECFLFENSDDRNLLNSKGLNKYGCKTTPFKKEFRYSSATASNVTKAQYDYLNNTFLKKSSFDLQQLRDRIRGMLGLFDEVDIAFGSSGTDIELLATLYGCATNKSVANIVCLLEEVGSGTALAAGGKHFTEISNIGSSVQRNKCIEGFDKFSIKIYTINVGGNSFQDFFHAENDLLSLIDKLLTENNHVILHQVYGSKLGRVFPSEDVIKLIEKRYAEGVDVVVDACQFRVESNKINSWLQSNRFVLLTGSKFFEGVTFSGIFLAPEKKRDRISKLNKIPQGLSQYFVRDMLPKRWTNFNGKLNSGESTGLFLRLESFLFWAEKFSAVNFSRSKKVIYIFKRCVEKCIEDSANIILYSPVSFCEDDFLDTIVSFRIIRNGESLSYDYCKLIYHMLQNPIGGNDRVESKYLNYRVCFPQPVLIKSDFEKEFVVMRVSLGAKKIIDLSGLVYKEIEENLMAELSICFKKLDWLIVNLTMSGFQLQDSYRSKN